MAHYNNGIVFTNENCIGCNKCISQCGIFGANVSLVKNGIKSIQVDSNKCLHCGKCINFCIHNARDYKDDFESFIDDLNKNEKISLILDQSFYLYFGDQVENLLGYFRSLGIEKIYNNNIGKEISIWAHTKYLKNSKNIPSRKKAFIAQTCSAVTNMIELYHPYLEKKIIPVQSPLICTAIYAKKYLGDNNKKAYIGACVAKKDEITCEQCGSYVNYNLTINSINRFLKGKKIDNYSCKDVYESTGMSKYIPIEETFLNCVSYFFPRNQSFLEYSSLSDNTFRMLEMCHQEEEDSYSLQPLMACVSACEFGCKEGPGMDKEAVNNSLIHKRYIYRLKDSLKDFTSEDSYEILWNNIDNLFYNINFDDFKRSFNVRYKQPYVIPSNTFEEIYIDMLKDSPAKRHINCRSCGYNSCHEMATAIAYGYNKKENCINYMNDEMERRYYTDFQTGISNRYAFTKDVTSILKDEKKTQYCMCVGDINNFKMINDLYGHIIGDKVLVEIAKELERKFKKIGLYARFGGGLFSIFFKFTMENLQLLRDIKYFDCSNIGVTSPITMRFGIYTSYANEDSVFDMINYATLCMDNSISSVQNTYSVFTSEFRDQINVEISTTSQLQPAMENNEFVLYFQPQYDAVSKKLVGAETLCRWIRPDGTIISPNLFIPIAEKNGMIRFLDNLIWKLAFKTIRKWIDDGIEIIPISINISRRNLESDGFIGIIDRLQKTYDIDPSYIHFEITESSDTSDKVDMIDRINKLKKLGFKVAMDDFGSGYSSLNSLKDIPIDILKLDMGFLDSKNKNADKGGTILSNVIRMAQTLGLKIIAEGVETQAQANLLKSLGCDIFQGFLYSKPLPENEFLKVLTSTDKKLDIELDDKVRNLNLNSFYDVNSTENFMFEYFTGPAILLEFNSDKDELKMIRCNDSLLELLELNDSTFMEINTYLLQNFFHSEFLTSIQKSIKENKNQVCYLKNINYNSGNKITTKCSIWNLNKVGERFYFYVMLQFQPEK